MNQSNTEKKGNTLYVPEKFDKIYYNLAAKERTPAIELEEAEKRGPSFQLTDSNRNKNVDMTQRD